MERVAQIQLTKPSNALTATSKTPVERQLACIALLLAFAEDRQATLSQQTQERYATILALYELRHVETVLSALGRSKRGDYEKAIPELGDLEEMVKQETKRVANIENPFVPCGKCINGVLIVNEYGQTWNHRIDKGETFARDCECKKAWLASRVSA